MNLRSECIEVRREESALRGTVDDGTCAVDLRQFAQQVDLEHVGVDVAAGQTAVDIDEARVAGADLEDDSVDRDQAVVQIENDLAHVIGEHKKYDSVFVSFYMHSLAVVLKKYFKKSVDISAGDVINVGSQYIVSERFIKSTAFGWWDLLRFALVFHREQERLRNTAEDISLEELFEKSILSSMAYTFLKKQEFFDIREEYRRAIDTSLTERGHEGHELRRFPYSGQLDSVIELNRDLAVWTTIRKRDSFGTQVVLGEFDKTKFFNYREGTAIPDGAVVLCDYLYPDIGRRIDAISGIVCANGSINSHVAILCRERNIPLVIQADIERYR